MNLLEQINRIERIDNLVRLKATGPPKQLAKKLGISKSTLYNIIGLIRDQGVEIYFCSHRQSFCYRREVYFYFGFSSKRINPREIKGGKQKNIRNPLLSPKILDWEKLLLCGNVVLQGLSQNPASL